MTTLSAIKLLTVTEVSLATGFPVATLRYWRHMGKGPKAGKFGGRVMYRESDVADWVNAAFEAEATA